MAKPYLVNRTRCTDIKIYTFVFILSGGPLKHTVLTNKYSEYCKNEI